MNSVYKQKGEEVYYRQMGDDLVEVDMVRTANDGLLIQGFVKNLKLHQLPKNSDLKEVSNIIDTITFSVDGKIYINYLNGVIGIFKIPEYEKADDAFVEFEQLVTSLLAVYAKHIDYKQEN